MSDKLIEAAKQNIIAYNEKDWDKVAASVTPGYVYDEVPTHRKVEGLAAVLDVWKGWATAFPDSKATIDRAYASGNTVIFEVTWNATHTGPMATPNGEIPATGKSASFRSVLVVEMEGDRASESRQYYDLTTFMSQLGINLT
tara:strand:+ start:315 stop:740 length:426 start_codon:yes stop_codon:yes gene_type:complete